MTSLAAKFPPFVSQAAPEPLHQRAGMDLLAFNHPGRTEQIGALVALIGQHGQPLPPAVVLHDACSPNTTSRLLLDLLSSSAAEQPLGHAPFLWTAVSPLTSINPTTLFRTILESLEDQIDAEAAGPSTSTLKRKRKPDTSLDYFLWKLQSTLSNTSASLVIAINDAERIRDLWPEHVWTAFCRLGSLTGAQGRLSVVFISSLPWSQYRTPSSLTVAHQPLTIAFPRLQRQDVLSVLSLDFPPLWKSYQSSVKAAQINAGTSPGLCSRSTSVKLKKAASGESISESALRHLYDQFTALFYDTIRSNVKDIEELRTMNAAVWHSFVVPVQTRECSVHDLQHLLLASSSLFRDVIVRLQTREIGPREWTSNSRMTSIQASKTRLQNTPQGTAVADQDVEMDEPEQLALITTDEEQKLDEEEWLEHQTQILARQRSTSSLATVSLLPSLALIPTFVVLASFMASYNPSRLDVRYFLRDDSLLGLSSGSSKGQKGGRKLGPGRGRKSGPKRGRPSKSALRVTNEDGQAENLNRQQLLGPRPFPIDRLLSIFQALITESAPEMSLVYSALVGADADRSTLWEYRSKSLSVYSQINNLVARRMLVRTSAQDKLGTSINFRTNVGYNVAAVLAKRVKFDLDEWLWDWGSSGGNTT